MPLSAPSDSARYVVRMESTRNLPVEAQWVAFHVWDTQQEYVAAWGTQRARRGNEDGLRDAREEAERRAEVLNAEADNG